MPDGTNVDIVGEAVANGESLSRADQLNRTGSELFGKGHVEPARMHFVAALQLEPNHSTALMNLGASLRSLGYHEAAASMARRAIAIAPNNMFARNNLAAAYMSLKQYGNALDCLLQITAFMPDYAPGWHNLGLTLYMNGQYQAAVRAFTRAMELGMVNPQIESDLSLTTMAAGDFGEGLELYESRWRLLAKNRVWDLGIERWFGQTLHGKHLLVHHEQGFGDDLMLARFLVTLPALGPKAITMAVPRELQKLYEDNFSPVVRTVLTDDVRAEDGYDFHCPMLDLPRFMGVRRPQDLGKFPQVYLKAEGNGDLIARLPQSPYRVGLAWASGKRGGPMDERRRVVPLAKFLPLTELPGVSVISLQVGAGVEEIDELGLNGIVFDMHARLTDFSVTASLIMALDIVVAVDSAVAHLAAALGKPVIMLGPYVRCWRWWNDLNGQPWYSNFPIFKQDKDGSWDWAVEAAVTEVRRRLRV